MSKSNEIKLVTNSLRKFDLLSIQVQQEILTKMSNLNPIDLIEFSKLVDISSKKIIKKLQELSK